MATNIPGTTIIIPKSGDFGGPTNDPQQTKQYKFSELYDLLGSNGFSGAGLDIGAAVIMAESQGHTLAKHINHNGSIDRGIWQINDKAHPEVSDACAYNPGCATRAAFKISNGGKDFSAWSTFKSGAYKQYYKGKGGTSKASGAQNAGIPDSIGTGALDGLKAIGAFFLALLQHDTWVRIMKVAGGAVLLILALHELGVNVTGPLKKYNPAYQAVAAAKG